MKLPKTPSFRLDGKRALVTGASSGIGLGGAVALAEAGADVVLAARRADKLEALATAFLVEGWHAESLVMDVSDTEGVAALLGKEAPFDILLNSAGMARHSTATDTDPDDFDAVMDSRASDPAAWPVPFTHDGLTPTKLVDHEQGHLVQTRVQ